MKQSGLLAEDGAIFIGRVDHVDGQFRATCLARLDAGSEVLEDMPEHKMFSEFLLARRWVHQVAATREFSKISWAEDSYKPAAM